MRRDRRLQMVSPIRYPDSTIVIGIPLAFFRRMRGMLGQRAQYLLKSLIERYIAEGQPVGSRVLSKHPGLELSPATIRNVMSDLEELGYIASPHTSAGRVPTPKGYRFFVDSLMVVKPLEEG